MIALSGWLTWHAKIEKGEAIFPCYFPRACLSLEWGLWHVGLVDCTDRSQLVGTLSAKHTLTPVRHRFRGQVSFALFNVNYCNSKIWPQIIEKLRGQERREPTDTIPAGMRCTLLWYGWICLSLPANMCKNCKKSSVDTRIQSALH